jgi:transcriptional regulator with XRE-family HTH domain
MLTLQRIREEQKLSRLEVSRRARISPTQYGLIENGRFCPYPTWLAAIARGLGFPEDRALELLEEDGTTHGDD